MDLNLIRNYVIRDKFYTAYIGMYFVPRKVKINNKLIDVVFNREKAILNDKSSYSINFKILLIIITILKDIIIILRNFNNN